MHDISGETAFWPCCSMVVALSALHVAKHVVGLCVVNRAGQGTCYDGTQLAAALRMETLCSPSC